MSEAIQGVIPPTKMDICSTGGSRSSRTGRGLPHLLPFDALIELSKHFEGGVLAGYDARNWEKGLPFSWYIDSDFRHLAGIDCRDATEEHFRAHAWNALCLLATKIRIDKGELPPELDDRRVPGCVAVGASTEALDSREEWAKTATYKHLLDGLIKRGLTKGQAERLIAVDPPSTIIH